MRRFLIPIMMISLVSILGFTLVIQGNITITIIPDAGPLGSTFDIQITGLTPNQDYTIFFIFESSNETAFQTTKTADSDGEVAFLIGTEDSDPTGRYLVQVRDSSGRTVAENHFELTEQAEVTDNITISPESAQLGRVHSITITQLTPNQTFTVEIRRADDNSLVYERRWTADENGRIRLQIFGETADTPGQYDVYVKGNNEQVVARGEMTIEALPPIEVLINPSSAPADATRNVLVTGLQPATQVVINIINADTGETIYTDTTLTTIGGEASFELDEEIDLADGSYIIDARQDGESIARGEFAVGAASTSIVSISIEPETAAVGSSHNILIQGLSPNETVMVDVGFAGESVFQTEQTANANGTIDFNIVSEEGDEEGRYTVSVLRRGLDIASSGFNVGGSDGVVTVPRSTAGINIGISPQSGEIGTTHVITANGLESQEVVKIQVDYAGQTLFTTSRLADDEGNIEFEITSQQGDDEGEYVVTLLRDKDAIAQAGFIIGDTSNVSPSAPAPSTEVIATITPEEGPIGTSHNISVTGLQANETVSLEIILGGDSVFAVDRIADANGNVSFNIVSEEGDPEGRYSVIVLRGNTAIAQTAFRIQGESVPPTAALVDVSITPESATVGSSHLIEISGLQPNETIILDIELEGQSVFSTERDADANGNISLSINSEEGDRTGTYTVNVIRSGDIVGSSDFTIESVDAAPPSSASNVTINIEPDFGVRGTQHVISVNGLEPNETIILDILLNGTSVYASEQTADANGGFALAINSEESDPLGIYTVNIVRDTDVVASADLTIGDDASDTTQAPQRSIDPNVSISIEPESASQGTAQLIRVSGLAKGERVRIDVLHDDEVIYSMERSVDAVGEVSISFISSQDNEAGDYTVNVIRDNTIVAENNLSITSSDVVQEPQESTGDVVVSIVPAEGQVGTSHEIQVTGLEPDETITLDIMFGGSSVFSTERTADTEGVVSLNIATEDGDREGRYDVLVFRNGRTIASGSLEVLGDDVVQEPTESTDQGTISGENVTGALSDEAPTAEYQFSGNAGDVISVTIESNDFDTYVQLLDATGNVVEEDDDSAGQLNAQISEFTLPETGIYTIIVTSNRYIISQGNFSASGNYVMNFSGDLMAGADVVQGDTEESSTDDTETTEPETSEPDETVETQPQEDTEDTTDDTETTDTTEPETSEPDETVETQPQEDTEDSATDDTETTDTAEVVPAPTDALSVGTQFTDVLEAANPVNEYTFSGQSGELVTFYLTSASFDTYIVLKDQNGEEILRDDDGGSGLNSLIGPYALPYSGTYTVEVSSFFEFDDKRNRNFNLQIDRVNAASLAFDSSQDVQFSSDEGIHYYSFDAELGDVINLSVLSNNGIDTAISLRDAQGEELLADDDGGANFDPEINHFVVEEAGTYHVVMMPYTPGDVGEVTLTLDSQAAASLDEGPQRIRLNIKRAHDVVTFEGTKGETALLSLEAVTGELDQPVISVVQNGRTLVTYDAQYIDGDIVLAFTLAEDGKVTVEMEDEGFFNAVYQMTIERMRR